MRQKSRKKSYKLRVAGEIMAGMRELDRMMDEGKTPVELFTVKTIGIPESRVHRVKDIRPPKDLSGPI